MIANGADMVEDYEKKLPMARFVETEHALVVKNYQKMRAECDKVFESDFLHDHMYVTVALEPPNDVEIPLLTKNVPVQKLYALNEDSANLDASVQFVIANSGSLNDVQSGYIQFEYHGATEQVSLVRRQTCDTNNNNNQTVLFKLCFDSDANNMFGGEATDADCILRMYQAEKDHAAHAIIDLRVDFRKLPNTLALLQRDYKLLHRHMTLKQMMYANQSVVCFSAK